MKKLTAASLVLFAFSAPAIAAPVCSNWLLQSDGSYFRICVDDQGRQYCERMYNNYITRVSCG